MVIGLVECASCHTRVIPMSPDNRCPSCQELIPTTETDVTSNRLQETQPEPFLNKPASTHPHDKWPNGWLDSSGSQTKAHEFESNSYRSFENGKMAHPESHAQQLLVKAIKLEARGRYEESFRLYQQILNEFPRAEATKDTQTRCDNLRIYIEGQVGTRETVAPASSKTRSTIRKTDNESAPTRRSALDVSRMAFVPKQLEPGQLKQETSISARSSTRKSDKRMTFISWVIALFVGSMVYQYLKPHGGVLAMFAGGFVAYVLQAFVYGYLAGSASATCSGRVARSAHTIALINHQQGMGKRNVLFWISLPIALVGSSFLLYEMVTETQAMYSLKAASEVIDARIVERGLHGVKYRFRLSEDGPEFFRKRGGREVWSQPGESRESPIIGVRYALENPFVSQPAHEPIISANRLLGMILLLAIALVPLVCLVLLLVPTFRARKETYSKVLVWYSALAILSGAIGVAASMLDPALRSYAEAVPRQVRIFVFGLAVAILAFIVGLIGYVLDKQK